MKPRIGFVSLMEACPWGGSELLWSQAATRLARVAEVHVSVKAWRPVPDAFVKLQEAGCRVHLREGRAPLPVRLLKRALPGRCFSPWESGEPVRWLRQVRPRLVVLSDGGSFGALDWMNSCISARVPFVLVLQAANEQWWPDDTVASSLLAAMNEAVEVCFVSERNRAIVEAELGGRIERASIVRNPINLVPGSPPPWPADGKNLRLACVGRLEPAAKGQDLICAVMGRPRWRERAVEVTLYGNGENATVLSRLCAQQCPGKVLIRGFKEDVRSIWAEHHALVLPSRYEGLPLSLIEALMCARPAVVTPAAGGGEIVTDGATGFVVPCPCVDMLDDAMERLWASRESLRAMGCRARQAVESLVPADPVGEFTSRLLRHLEVPWT